MAESKEVISKERRKDITLPRFEGQDFISWKTQVLAYLDWQAKADVVNKSKPRRYASNAVGITEADRLLREQEIELYDANDKYVKTLLLVCLGAKQVRSVLQCKSAKEIWDKLSSINEQKSTANRLQLQKEFSNLKFDDKESLNDYISRAEGLQGQLQDIGVKHIDEATLCCQIVCGLPDSYRGFMSTWANLDQDKQVISELIARLGAEEQLVMKFGEGPSALNTEVKPKKKKKKPKSKSNKCYGCGEEGHFKRDCPNLDESEMKGDAAVAV